MLYQRREKQMKDHVTTIGTILAKAYPSFYGDIKP